MKGAPEVRDGTRVRVVLEGVATNSRFGRFVVGEWDSHMNYIDPDADHVVSVEILPDPLGVGDRVTSKVLDRLPPGSVIRGAGGTHAIKGNFHWATGNGTFAADVLGKWDARVVYIPEAQ